MKNALKTLLAFIVGFVVVFVIGVLLFVYSGVYNVAADEPHLRAVEWLLETTRTRSVAERADAVTPPADLASTERVQQGAHLYASMCQMCHLGPGIKPTPFYQGLNPKPPVLAEAVPHHSTESLFWIVKHGIKMTGMPAWGETHSDEQLWDIVAFLNQLPEMAPQRYKELAHGANHSH